MIDQSIHTGDATGRLLFNMLGAIAQFETEIRFERQMDGIQNAKTRGVSFGRTKRLTQQQSTELCRFRQQGVLIKTLMKDFNLSKSSVYRYLAEAEETQTVREKNDRKSWSSERELYLFEGLCKIPQLLRDWL